MRTHIKGIAKDAQWLPPRTVGAESDAGGGITIANSSVGTSVCPESIAASRGRS